MDGCRLLSSWACLICRIGIRGMRSFCSFQLAEHLLGDLLDQLLTSMWAHVSPFEQGSSRVVEQEGGGLGDGAAVCGGGDFGIVHPQIVDGLAEHIARWAIVNLSQSVAARAFP